MPTRYNYVDRTTTVSCSQCSRTRTVSGRADRDSLDVDGRLVTDFIRYLNARGVFHSWCRECERAANRSGRAAAPRRAAQSAGRATPTSPSERKFGVELELIFPGNISRHQVQDALRADGLTSWAAKGDGSLSGGNGIEVVSPPLRGEDGFDQLRRACRILRRLGARPNRTCGLHVHHEIRDCDVATIKALVGDWHASRGVIDGLVSPSRRAENRPYYCMPLTDADLRRVGTLSAMSDLRGIGIDRYKTLNLRSYGRHGTIEIRQHQGTCDYEKIRSWTLLVQAMIDRARCGVPMPAESTRTVRGLVERLGALLDETARTFTIGRAVEFGYATV